MEVLVVSGLTVTGRNEREENAKPSTLVAQAASNRVGIIMVGRRTAIML
jgi:hypothetical protein